MVHANEAIVILFFAFGTRASLVYIRRHGPTVRTATLNGCAPIEFRNPLYHAKNAQEALDLIFDEVESNERYRKAFPNLREKFATILKRFDEQGPVEVEIKMLGIPLPAESVTRPEMMESHTSVEKVVLIWLTTGDIARPS